MFVVSVAVFLFVIACLMARRMQLGEMATVHRHGRHLLHLELRRCIEMRTHADGLGGFSYPEPAETRILTWQCCGLPVWSRTESIGLPASCESRIDEVRPEDFDQHFTPAFRLASQRSSPARRSSHAAAT